jgi:hypothetical protein
MLDTNTLSASAEGERNAVKEFGYGDAVAIPMIAVRESSF